MLYVCVPNVKHANCQLQKKIRPVKFRYAAFDSKILWPLPNNMQRSTSIYTDATLYWRTRTYRQSRAPANSLLLLQNTGLGNLQHRETTLIMNFTQNFNLILPMPPKVAISSTKVFWEHQIHPTEHCRSLLQTSQNCWRFHKRGYFLCSFTYTSNPTNCNYHNSAQSGLAYSRRLLSHNQSSKLSAD